MWENREGCGEGFENVAACQKWVARHAARARAHAQYRRGGGPRHFASTLSGATDGWMGVRRTASEKTDIWDKTARILPSLTTSEISSLRLGERAPFSSSSSCLLATQPRSSFFPGRYFHVTRFFFFLHLSFVPSTCFPQQGRHKVTPRLYTALISASSLSRQSRLSMVL